MFEAPSHDACPYCEYLAGKSACAFVHRDGEVAAFMNRSQYERGAVLLIPNEHVESILDLDAALMSALFGSAQRIARAMVECFGAVGLNMFQNNGIQAGQSIAHYHIHLVPRYETSVPWRRFREADFPRTPRDELERLAGELRAGLVQRG
jgi:histidine triad (HIT) family protein